MLSDISDPAVLEEGLYVCGWLKRGPTGIIATNLYCAEETVCVFCFSIHVILKTVIILKTVKPTE